MSVFAIRGHQTRGNEVIKVLEMLGGNNYYEYSCCQPLNLYYIDKDDDNHIKTKEYREDRKSNFYSNYTLEEFEKLYPYKIGDKVYVYDFESEVRIDDMKWNGFEIQYKVFTDETEWYSAAELNKFNKHYCQSTDETEWYSTDELNKVNKPYCPSSYYGCLAVMDYSTTDEANSYKYNLFHCFQSLIICRDAYWATYNYKPNWSDESEIKYCIVNTKGKIKLCVQKTTNKILAFPTEEIRDLFYENFRHLIEICQEFL